MKYSILYKELFNIKLISLVLGDLVFYNILYIKIISILQDGKRGAGNGAHLPVVPPASTACLTAVSPYPFRPGGPLRCSDRASAAVAAFTSLALGQPIYKTPPALPRLVDALSLLLPTLSTPFSFRPH